MKAPDGPATPAGEAPGTAVVLLQMGAPRDVASIRPFLYQLFSDRNIVPLPGPASVRKGLAALIALVRSRRVADRYRAIGGGSPVSGRIDTDLATEVRDSYEAWKDDPRYQRWMTDLAMQPALQPMQAGQ